MLSPADIILVPAPMMPPIENPPAPSGLFCEQGFRTGKLVDEGLHLIGWALLEQEVEDNANRFFCGTSVDANVGDETPDQALP